MSIKATARSLQSDQHYEFTNTTGKAVELVLRTQSGTMVRTTLPIGGQIDFVLGQESGALYVLEPDQAHVPLRLVK